MRARNAQRANLMDANRTSAIHPVIANCNRPHRQINQPSGPPTCQSMNQSVCLPINQSINQPTNQPINQPMHESISTPHLEAAATQPNITINHSHAAIAAGQSTDSLQIGHARGRATPNALRIRMQIECQQTVPNGSASTPSSKSTHVLAYPYATRRLNVKSPGHTNILNNLLLCCIRHPTRIAACRCARQSIN